MRFVLSSACLFLVATAWHGAVAQPLNKDNVRHLSANPPPNQETLQAGTFHGGVHMPARGFIQRLMVGFERTGERCSVTVQRGNTVQVSFLGDAVIPLVSTSRERFRTDLFVGELGAGQVLIVQHRRGEVVSITQTVYDANGDVVYGRSGVGDVIRECVLPMTTSEKSAGRERCKK